jgi:hypothetical protein
LNKDSTLVVIKIISAAGGDFKDTLIVASSAGTKTLPIAAWVGKAVSGEVSGSWTAPLVKVEGDIVVPNGKTLQIAPSTTVEFLGHFKLDVQGRLLAIGQNAKLITFTGSILTGWKGIRFNYTPSANDSSKIQFCILENGRNRGENLEAHGGAICADHFSKLVISDCIIRNNDAMGYSGGGIGLRDSANVLVKNCQIINNRANEGGGIGIYNKSFPKIINNHISGNYAENWGGGILADWGSKPTVVNNLIDNNISFSGGAVKIVQGSSADFYNNTVVDNIIYFSLGEGSGIMVSGSSRLLAVNNIIYGNKYIHFDTKAVKKYNQVYFNIGSDGDFYNNDIQGGRDSMVVEEGYTLQGAYTDNISVNPKLVTFGTEAYYPANNSPCVNKGKADINLNDLGTTMDLLGYPRIYGGRIDIGAFESSGLVNIKETGLPEELVVYPNPSTGKFRVIEVINILGERVLHVQNSGDKNLVEIDLSNQPKGMYMIRTNLKGENFVKKVVIN